MSEKYYFSNYTKAFKAKQVRKLLFLGVKNNDLQIFLFYNKEKAQIREVKDHEKL